MSCWNCSNLTMSWRRNDVDCLEPDCYDGYAMMTWSSVCRGALVSGDDVLRTWSALGTCVDLGPGSIGKIFGPILIWSGAGPACSCAVGLFYGSIRPVLVCPEASFLNCVPSKDKKNSFVLALALKSSAKPPAYRLSRKRLQQSSCQRIFFLGWTFAL
jgi:hypothetical protein